MGVSTFDQYIKNLEQSRKKIASDTEIYLLSGKKIKNLDCSEKSISDNISVQDVNNLTWRKRVSEGL